MLAFDLQPTNPTSVPVAMQLKYAVEKMQSKMQRPPETMPAVFGSAPLSAAALLHFLKTHRNAFPAETCYAPNREALKSLLEHFAAHSPLRRLGRGEESREDASRDQKSTAALPTMPARKKSGGNPRGNGF